MIRVVAKSNFNFTSYVGRSISTGTRLTSFNPNGIAHSSPGLRGTSYPGLGATGEPEPQRGSAVQHREASFGNRYNPKPTAGDRRSQSFALPHAARNASCF